MAPPKLKIVTEDHHTADDTSGGRASTAPITKGGDDDAPPGLKHDGVPQTALAAIALLEAEKAAQEAAESERMAEAILFAAAGPLTETAIGRQLPAGCDVTAVLTRLQHAYATRGVNLVRVGGGWAFRTAEDLSWLLEKHTSEERKLSRAALETLAIIAYHQPVTRAEVEEIRGVTTSKGTLDVLLETGWVRPRGRRRAPGRPVTYGTTDAFLAHFSLDAIRDLPGLAELKGAGLLDGNLPPGFSVPEPTDVAALMPDELPLDDADEEAGAAEADLFDHPDEEADGDADDRGADAPDPRQVIRTEPDGTDG